MTTSQAVILGIVEGLTEFLPISSTGHMMLAQALLKMPNNEFTKVFIVNIQFGAILSVLILYWKRFFYIDGLSKDGAINVLREKFDFYLRLFVAFLPAAVLGLLFKKHIDKMLSSITTVAISWLVGGIVLVLIDKIFKSQIDEAAQQEDTVRVKTINEFGVEIYVEKPVAFVVSWSQAFIIGCFQTISMIPGVSRSAATIVGALTQKFNIKKAAEFSFFLAVPTVFGAAVFETYKGFYFITGSDIGYLVIGNIVSFVVGVLAIKFFIDLITHFGLKFFGYYRIILGGVIIILLLTGHKLEIAG